MKAKGRYGGGSGIIASGEAVEALRHDDSGGLECSWGDVGVDE